MSFLSSLTLLTVIVMMMPGGGGDANIRAPPKWDPEMERGYPLRAYTQDVLLWIAATDLQPHQQVAAIIQRLTGMGKVLARLMSPVELVHGGTINGTAADPVTLLFHALHLRFGPLAEETRLQALTDMMHFRRRQGECIDDLLTSVRINQQPS